MKSAYIIILMAVLWGVAGAAHGAELTYVIGDVSLRSGEAWRPARQGAAVEPGTVIKTGDSSLAIVTLEDRSILKITAGTTFTFGDPGATKGSGPVLTLDRGTI